MHVLHNYLPHWYAADVYSDNYTFDLFKGKKSFDYFDTCTATQRSTKDNITIKLVFNVKLLLWYDNKLEREVREIVTKKLTG